MKFIEKIKNVINTVAASIKEAARKIVERYDKWRERLRQKKAEQNRQHQENAEQNRQHQEYMDDVLRTAIPYHAENVDEELATKCRLLIKRFFSHSVEQTLLELDVEERIELIEKFTNEVAKLMNIQINDVKFFTSRQAGNRYCGFYNHNNRLIAMNIDFIACDRPEIMREVINTVLHECKHSRQYFAVVEGVDYGYSKELLQNWYRNIQNYIPSQECDEAYRKQPLEVDSFGFADNIIKA
jgi:hypothetical protein